MNHILPCNLNMARNQTSQIAVLVKLNPINWVILPFRKPWCHPLDLFMLGDQDCQELRNQTFKGKSQGTSTRISGCLTMKTHKYIYIAETNHKLSPLTHSNSIYLYIYIAVFNSYITNL